MKAAQAGFTLLEILVAIVVLGFILAGLTGGMRFGIQAYDRQIAQVDAGGDLDAVDRTLRRLIGQMEPGDRLQGEAIVGTADALAFTGTLPTPGKTDRLAIDLRVENGTLILLWRPDPHATPLAPEPPSRRDILLRGVRGVQFGYMGRDGVWTERWNSAAPPRLVRLHLIFPTGDPRHWPDLVAAPARN